MQAFSNSSLLSLLKRKKYLYVCFFAFHSFFIQAQTPSAINYTIEDGLLSNETYDLFQDKDGFIWIGSNAGANRFDGTNMMSYTVKEGLADNDVLSVHQDSRDKIWFLSYNGKLSYWKNGEVFNEDNDESLKDISSESYFTSFLEDGDRALWFGTRFNGIFKLDSSRTVKHFSQSTLDNAIKNWPQKEAYPVLHLFLNRKKWVCFSNQIGSYSINNNELSLLSEHKDKQWKGRFCNMNSNLLFTSTANRISLMNVETGQLIWEKSIPEVENINAIEFLSDSLLYVATNVGVFSLNQGGEIIDHLLKGKKATDILIDREGNLWISTIHNGIYLFRNRTVLNFETKAKYSILKIQNSILFGGEDLELHRIDGNELTPVPLEFETVKTPQTEDRIIALAIDSVNQIWMGTFQGLFHMNNMKAELKLSTGAKQLLFMDSSLIMIDINNYLLKLNRDTLLDNLFLSNTDNMLVNRNKTISIAEKYMLYHGAMNSLLKTKDGHFLIATRNGVLSKEDAIQPLDDLPKGEIVALEEVNSGDLWVLGKNEGLYYYRSNEKQLDTLNLLQSDENINYTSLYSEEDNSVWLGSDKGLIHVTLNENKYNVDYFNIGDGLRSEQINDILISHDTIWIATSTGISMFPKRTFTDTVPPLLYIDSISTDHSRSYSELSNLSIDGNTLEVHFTGISFKEELHYDYELDGEVNQAGSVAERTLLLRDLPPSDYQLTIVAVSSNGNRSAVKTIDFTVEFNLWKSWKLWIPFATLLLLIGLAVYNRLLRKLNVKEQDKTIMVKSVLTGERVKIRLGDLLFVQASRDYMELYTNDKKVLVRITMKEMVKKLEGNETFLRVHRSYVVNLNKVDSFKQDALIIMEHEIPIAKSSKKAINEYLSNRNS